MALSTPLQQINLALDGRIDFLKKTNPWGTQEEPEETDLMKKAADPEGAAKELIAFVKRRGAQALPAKAPEQDPE